jgi:glycosyltransferase involved in cell wall biosynthesis
VDAQSLAPRTLKINDPPRLVFAGRFVGQKNPLMVPRVLATLKDLRWECVMLGNGALLEETRTEVERLGLADRFKFPGWVETSDVLDEFSRSDVLFMPSRVEGLPVVGVQALACGLALVVGRAGGFADLVAHGENGFLHDADDADGLATSLSALLSDPAALLSARQKSLTLAQSFDIEHVVDEYEKTLLAIINREAR